MKILMLAEIDYAASGHKLCDAINKHTEHEIEIWTGPYHNKLKHPNQTNIITRRNVRDVQKRVNRADIVHVKGDWIARDGYLGLRIQHKPTVQTTSGSFARKIADGGYGKFHPTGYSHVTLRTSFEPDLLYPEYSDIWTPHPIDSIGKNVEWTFPDVPVLIHTPTTRIRKNSAFAEKVFELVRAKREIEVRVIEGVSFEEAVRRRKESTIFFDQFLVGFYGNSALEAMQYGIPVSAWISKEATEQANGQLKECPIIRLPLDMYQVKTVEEKTEMYMYAEMWAELIIKILDHDKSIKDISRRTKQWCDSKHSYQSVAKQWDALYKSI